MVATLDGFHGVFMNDLESLNYCNKYMQQKYSPNLQDYSKNGCTL